ncbi:alpha/beta fold hydrolase [Pseudonocardia phyllosphaerae]|uniref:alpha/beta fold hydrolase n=1 Tax=Pseudonocardia phyllosphaerae TaxID=3390502 RepID=UPI00397E3E95
MSRTGWTVAGIAGGLAGAAGAAVGVGVTNQRRRIAASRRSLATEMAEYDGNPPAGVVGEDMSVTADDGVRLACEEVLPADGSEPVATVVLIHGFALDRRTWQEQRPFLAGLSGPSVRLVLYDQRSHGRSERAPAESCTIAQLGHDLDAVIRSLAPTGPLVLVSHSMGGMTVMALAEQNPELFRDRVVGVALISTSAGEMASSGLPGTFLSRRNPIIRGLSGLAAWQPGLVEGGRRALGDVIWAFTKHFAYGDKQVDPAMVDLVDTMIDANAVGALTDFVDTLGTHDRIAALPGLSDAEVLVLAGDADRIIPYRHSEVIADAIPTARLVRDPGVGHMPMLETPDLVDGELGDLIERSMERVRGGKVRLRRPEQRRKDERTGRKRSGTAKGGAQKNGAAKGRAPRNGAPKGRASKNSAAKAGTAKDTTPKDGDPKNGPGRDNGPNGTATDAGTSTGGSARNGTAAARKNVAADRARAAAESTRNAVTRARGRAARKDRT